MLQPRANRQTLWFVCLVLFLDTVGFGLILPVLPGLITELSDLPNNRAAEVAGYLLFAFAGMQFLFAPVLAGLSDRYGRRPVLLLALFGFSINYFLMAAAPTLAWLFVARMISGLFGASYAAANACIADISSAEDRAKGFGMAGAAMGLGFVFGPAIGGLLGEYGVRIPFIVAGVVTLLTMFYGFVFLPETLKPENRRPFEMRRANPIGNLLAVRRSPAVVMLLAALFFLQLANQSYASIWSFFTIEIANWTPLEIGLSVAFYGVMLVTVQGGLTGKVVKRFGEIGPAVFGLAIGIMSYVGLAFAAEGWHIYLWICVGGLGALAFPAILSLMTRVTPADAQGELQGIVSSSYSLSAIIGPIVMSQVFSAFTTGGGYHFPGAPFIGAALLVVTSLAIFGLGVRNRSSRAVDKPAWR